MFKEDEKAKVGRPRLAKDELISKARYSIFISLAICLVLGYCLFSYLNGKSPLDSIYSVSLKKVFGELSNKNGFIVNSYYDSNQDYIMNIKASDKVKSYQGNYVYQTYYLKNNKWVLKDEKEIYTNKESFKIKFESKEIPNNNASIYEFVSKVQEKSENGYSIGIDTSPNSQVSIYDPIFKDYVETSDKHRGHMMTFKRFDDNYNVVVESWGREFIISNKDIKKVCYQASKLEGATDKEIETKKAR